MVTICGDRKTGPIASRQTCVPQPDDPSALITTEQLEAVRGAAADYIHECEDDPPLSETEQMLSLSVGGVMPTHVRGRFGGNHQAMLAWVVATCCFVRLAHPDNARKAAPALYALLDEIEMAAPVTWLETYAVVESILREGGFEMGERVEE